MKHAALYLAAVPEPHTILGVRLKPYSVGHVELLHRVQSSFVTGEEHSYEDLATSIAICAQTYEGAIESFSDPKLPKIMRKWAKKVGEFNLPEKCFAFERYMREGSVHLDAFFLNVSESSPLDCPLHQIIKVFLMAHLNHTPEEANNKPWGLALSDWITWKAIQGQAQIVDAGELSEQQKRADSFDLLVRGRN